MRAEGLHGSVSMYNMASLSGRRRAVGRFRYRLGDGKSLLGVAVKSSPDRSPFFSRSRCHPSADAIIPSGCGLSHVSDGSYSTHRPISKVLRGVMSCHSCPFQRLSFLVCHPALSFFITPSLSLPTPPHPTRGQYTLSPPRSRRPPSVRSYRRAGRRKRGCRRGRSR